VLREWAKPIYDRILLTAAGRNVTEWCKKADCWTVVRTLNLSTQTDLTRYAVGDGRGEGPRNCHGVALVRVEQLATPTVAKAGSVCPEGYRSCEPRSSVS